MTPEEIREVAELAAKEINAQVRGPSEFPIRDDGGRIVSLHPTKRIVDFGIPSKVSPGAMAVSSATYDIGESLGRDDWYVRCLAAIWDIRELEGMDDEVAAE